MTKLLNSTELDVSSRSHGRYIEINDADPLDKTNQGISLYLK